MELDGDKQAPFPDVIATAIALDGRLAAIQDAFAPALFDHLEPYQDAMRDPDHADEMRDLHDDPHTFDQILAIATPEQALVATDITGVEIGMEGSVVRLLLKMATLWDDEHHVGAYFDDWQFVELNGSV